MTQLSKGVSSVLNKAVGLITANYSAKHRTAVSEVRPIASLPYMGRYRVMDFALSNMVNCGLRTVGFIMPDNYRSLVDHIDSGKDWMLGRKNGGLFILPGSSFGTTRTGYRFLLRDLLQNKAFLRRNSQPYVILSTANMVYNMDYAKLVEAHEASGADITLATFHAVENDDDVVRIELKDGQVADIHQGVTYGDTAFLDCMVMGRQWLMDVLDVYASVDHLGLLEAMKQEFDRIDIRTYDFDGYVAPVFSTESYFHRNMDLLDPTVSSELFPADRPILTKDHDTPPAKYERGCYVRNSIVSAGCRVWGAVSNSILSRNVVVEPGATVTNSIIMQACTIHSGARIENAIIDRNNDIPAGTELRGTPEAVLVKEKGRS